MNARSEQPSTLIIPPDTNRPKPTGGLYIHVPFCTTKCGYCDFYSVPAEGQPVDRVVTALVRELRLRMEPPPLTPSTVFIGGGTPTILEFPQLETLLDAAADAVAAGDVAEFTVEANPATIDDAKAALLVEHGVTRLSLGAQSFHPAELAFLERLHNPADVPAAVDVIRRAGIKDFNLDLMFGMPGQTLASWDESLSRTLELGPTHIACYGLIYEPGTALTKRLKAGAVTPCDDGLEAEMYLAAVDRLAAAGFEHYEISNFARPGHRCRHNLIYWNNEPYVGVGPSAAGYIDGRRYRNVASHTDYVRRIESGGDAVVESETLTGADLAMETLMLQLRLIDGLSLEAFATRTGIDLRAVAAGSIERMCSMGFLEESAGRLRLTRQGLLMADAVISELAWELDKRRNVSLPVISVGSRTPGH